MIPERFETDRLTLRPIAPADAPDIFASYAQDSVVSRYLTWMPHKSVADTDAYIAHCLAQPADVSRTFAIVRRPEQVLIGAFDVRQRALHAIGYGYVLTRSAWGQGFMTEVLRQVADWALAQPDIYRIADVCHVDNPASARVMEKAGLTREGTLRRWGVFPNLGPDPRDCYLYARVK